MSVKPYSEYLGEFATNGEEDPQIYLKIRIWTALRSLRPEFFTVCNEMFTGVDITFFWIIARLFFNYEILLKPQKNFEIYFSWSEHDRIFRQRTDQK